MMVDIPSYFSSRITLQAEEEHRQESKTRRIPGIKLAVLKKTHAKTYHDEAIKVCGMKSVKS